MSILYSARWVLPIVSQAIENGAVAVADSRIVAVGSRRDLAAKFPASTTKDFGEAAILPGFVNTHSHLELTVMRGFLEREEHDFLAWLCKLTVARMAMTSEDLLVSATCGAMEAARAGVTCVGDSSSFATQAMMALQKVGLRGIVYQESFGPDPNLAEENVAKLRGQVAEMRGRETALVRAGISPHATYTVSARQLEKLSRLAIDERLPLMMHAAESMSEELLMREGRGPFADGLKERGIEWRTPGISTIQYLKRHGLLETQPLLAHCIHVDDADLDSIKQSAAAIAHCPKSNAKLGHGRAPFADFVDRGLKVGLGSDSVASNNTCDILEEARFATLLAHLDQAAPPVSAEQALFTATLGGARALGFDNEIGSLVEGMQADTTVISLDGAHQAPARNPADTLVFSSSGRDVLMTMVAGEEIYRDQSLTNANEDEVQAGLKMVRGKLEAMS